MHQRLVTVIVMSLASMLRIQYTECRINKLAKKTRFSIDLLCAWAFFGRRCSVTGDEYKIGAGNEIRTRDPNLGKVVLYH